MKGLAPLGRVSGVLLAAGESRRFGGIAPKQLYEFRGKPLVRRAAETALASELAEVLVVVGHRGKEVARALAGLPLTVVTNPDWQQGQSTSVRAGLSAVSPSSSAALFIPCDQPLLTREVLDALVEVHRRSGSPVVMPAFKGRRGAPTLFGRPLFEELEALSGDTGGRQILRRHEGEALFVPLSSEAPLLDVDEPEDLKELAELVEDGGVVPGALAPL